MTKFPVLYSFRRCPYAIRARMALKYSGLTIELRDIQLKNKPKEMLLKSPKATVPVLILTDDSVIDESLDIMLWALRINDPENWMNELHMPSMLQLITHNDSVFKEDLDHYKYADRFPKYSAEHYRKQGEVFLNALDNMLQSHSYLYGHSISLADIAIMPFIRQFAYVDIDWFQQSQYQDLNQWLASILSDDLFLKIMAKLPEWDQSDDPEWL